MIREDFLLREIRRLVELLVETRRQRQARQLDEALATLDEASRSVLGLDSAVLARSPHPTLLLLLSTEDGLDLGRAASAGMVLQERAAILELRGQQAEADEARLRAVATWLELVRRAPWAGQAGPEAPVVVDAALLDDLRALAEGVDPGRLPAELAEVLAALRT